ncbi:hypothetical protein yfred0001_14950 [Yersinia frederiksenii ATCC 33641]|nr:hypothetical protein yfred0001_14950 [Yersinia frederiksenii ATCC 33641]
MVEDPEEEKFTKKYNFLPSFLLFNMNTLQVSFSLTIR